MNQLHVAVLGYDLEGRSSFAYFSNLGHRITILDQNPHTVVPDGVESVLGEDYLDNLNRFDLIVRTAGLPPHKIFDVNPSLPRTKVTTQINEFFAVSSTQNIIGVTGTKGKGTTSSLITAMLRAAGKTVHLGGNIGVPVLELLSEITPTDWVVLELSSFQLIDLLASPTIAVCLMVVPEHLNWHADMAEYITAKQQLFKWQTSDNIAIYYPESEYSTMIASAGNGTKFPYFAPPGAVVIDDMITIDSQSICDVSELKLLGAHNWQNACAAVTASWQVTQSVDALKEALTSFGGLEHRLEHVRTLHGIEYYDDSFGTTPETAIVAIQAFEQPKILIIGGSDKGASYTDLARTIKASSVRQVLLIGEQADRIRTALEAEDFHTFIDGGSTMTEIVQTAVSIAEPGDVVLLSTGCASFDMFANYKDRGDQFKTAVMALSVD